MSFGTGGVGAKRPQIRMPVIENPRPVGRPRGVCDMHGKAKLVDQKKIPLYLVRVAKMVRDARIERDVSVDELSRASGVDRWSIWKLEACRNSANLSTLVRLALALGMQPSELLP